MIFRLIVTAAAVLAASSTPLQRLKRSSQCRLENTFVGGTPSDKYHMEVKIEQDCIDLCKSMDNCAAVNFFPNHEACLPQVETKEQDPSIESREEEGTVYIVVKGCTEQVEPNPEEQEQPSQRAFWAVGNGSYLGRRKRDVNPDCRLDDVLVGGSVVNDKYIEKDGMTLEDCIEECQKLDECNAVNYFDDACLPQRETLASEDKDRLASREEPGTVYVVVKNCNGKIEKPANILPPATADESGEESTEESGDESTEEEGTDQQPSRRAFWAVGNGSYLGRRKRDVNPDCRLDDVLVGGSVVNDKYIEKDGMTLEDCIEECQKLDECNAVNYFDDACLPQRETLASEDKDRLASREEPGTVYVVVKNCNGKIEKPANILPPVKDEDESDESDESEEGTQEDQESNEDETEETEETENDVDTGDLGDPNPQLPQDRDIHLLDSQAG